MAKWEPCWVPSTGIGTYPPKPPPLVETRRNPQGLRLFFADFPGGIKSNINGFPCSAPPPHAPAARDAPALARSRDWRASASPPCAEGPGAWCRCAGQTLDATQYRRRQFGYTSSTFRASFSACGWHGASRGSPAKPSQLDGGAGRWRSAHQRSSSDGPRARQTEGQCVPRDDRGARHNQGSP